jgi:hypothetical protein
MEIKSERELAVEVVKLLDGVPIDKAKNALEHAAVLLLSTQIVSANTPLLTSKDSEASIRMRQAP